jgi:hypothetical protein
MIKKLFNIGSPYIASFIIVIVASTSARWYLAYSETQKAEAAVLKTSAVACVVSERI